MRTLRKWIRYFFGFSRTETNGFLLLLPMVILIIVSEPLYSWWKSRNPRDYTDRQPVLDSLVAQWRVEDSLKVVQQETVQAARHHLFMFDPNTATTADLETLGFSEKITRHILAYRAKGGKFRVKRDLKKIYGLDSIFFRKVQAYIRLPDSVQRPAFKPFVTEPRAAPVAFDLNEADTTQLIAIYGIGSRLSQRIIAYREKLGGFVNLGQLKEVWGLDTATVRRLTQKTYVRPDYVPRKLNINTAGDKELSTHPYISIRIAKAIVAYRFQHGNFDEVTDICGLQIVKREDADKIIPYLSVSP